MSNQSKVRWFVREVGGSVLLLLATFGATYLALTMVGGMEKTFALALIVVSALATGSPMAAMLWVKYERLCLGRPLNAQVSPDRFEAKRFIQRSAYLGLLAGVGGVSGLFAVGWLLDPTTGLVKGVVAGVISVGIFAGIVPIWKREVSRDIGSYDGPK
jgi:hypothetical protein